MHCSESPIKLVRQFESYQQTFYQIYTDHTSISFNFNNKWDWCQYTFHSNSSHQVHFPSVILLQCSSKWYILVQFIKNEGSIINTSITLLNWRKITTNLQDHNINSKFKNPKDGDLGIGSSSSYLQFDDQKSFSSYNLSSSLKLDTNPSSLESWDDGSLSSLGWGWDLSMDSCARSRKGLNPTWIERYPNAMAPTTTSPDLIAFLRARLRPAAMAPPSPTSLWKRNTSLPHQ